ncbi:hypothetical protein ACRQ4C_01455 [Curtobacterium sp. SP.BCp]|uniref:hypothetical protein n=1 Tax=Curtobacterium sp. SP.BCp TaxID=3435230 RepID=UPI003F731B2C
MSTPTVTTTTANNVAAIVEQYRYAEAQLHRRRQTLCGPSLTDREALRLIYVKADTDQPCTPRTVATELRITAASTTALLDRLQGASLITGTPKRNSTAAPCSSTRWTAGKTRTASTPSPNASPPSQPPSLMPTPPPSNVPQRPCAPR